MKIALIAPSEHYNEYYSTWLFEIQCEIILFLFIDNNVEQSTFYFAFDIMHRIDLIDAYYSLGLIKGIE